MILTIDIGNTNITVGVLDGRKPAFVGRLSTHRAYTSDELSLSMLHLLQLYRFDYAQLTGGIVSCVVPQLSATIEEAVTTLFGFKPLMVGPGVKSGVNILIDNPSQLGADLVATSVGTVSLYPLPAIVIDMGTATKIGAIDKNRSFIGCSIVPGIRIMLDALSGGTAQLPQIGLSPPRRVIGTNTVDSMSSGIIYGNASLLDGMITRYAAHLGPVATIVATGGYAHRVVPYCEHDVVYNEDLLLIGLSAIYERNQ